MEPSWLRPIAAKPGGSRDVFGYMTLTNPTVELFCELWKVEDAQTLEVRVVVIVYGVELEAEPSGSAFEVILANAAPTTNYPYVKALTYYRTVRDRSTISDKCIEFVHCDN